MTRPLALTVKVLSGLTRFFQHDSAPLTPADGYAPASG